MRAGIRAVAQNIVAVLGLAYVFTLVLILKTMLWQPHITSFSTDSIGRIIFVHLVWQAGYFFAAFVAGAAASLVIQGKRRWLWFTLFLLCLLPSLIAGDLRTWHETPHRVAAGVVGLLTALCAIAGFMVGEVWFWKGRAGEAA